MKSKQRLVRVFGKDSPRKRSSPSYTFCPLNAPCISCMGKLFVHNSKVLSTRTKSARVHFGGSESQLRKRHVSPAEKSEDRGYRTKEPRHIATRRLSSLYVKSYGMNAVTTTISLRAAAPVSARSTRRSAALRASQSKIGRSKSGRAVAVFASKDVKETTVSAAEKKTVDTGRFALLATIASNPILFGAQEAFAKGGEYGILEGRTAALVHPLFLGGLWFATVYAGYTGLQWRRVRTTQEDIVALKATVLVKEMVTTSGETEAVALTPAQRETQTKIDELTSTRKELVAGGFKDKHFNMGSLLLSFGIVLAVEGGMNTYMRVGKLFPGPHLYAGMGIVCLWAMAAGLVPEMQKGNDKARSAHIALNCVNLALFTWQIPTGLEIVGKVFQFTSWP